MSCLSEEHGGRETLADMNTETNIIPAVQSHSRICNRSAQTIAPH
jgi:hypothetical protein